MWSRVVRRAHSLRPSVALVVGIITCLALMGGLWLSGNAISSFWPAAALGDHDSQPHTPPNVQPRIAGAPSAQGTGHQPNTRHQPTTGSAALDAALSQRSAFQRDQAFYALAARGDAAAAANLVRALGNLAGPSADTARAVLLQRLADLDPLRALDLLKELDATLAGRSPDLLAGVFDTWGRRDFDSAIAHLALLDGHDSAIAAAALLRVALERGEDFDAFVARMPDDLPDQQLRAVAARQQALSDPAGAWKGATARHDDQAMSSVLRVWASADAPSAMAAAESVSARSLRTELRDVVLTVWLLRDPTAALNGAIDAGLDRPGVPGFDSLMFRLGTQADAGAIVSMLGRLPSESRDAALTGLLAGAIASNPELAWQALRRLQMPDSIRARSRLTALRQTAATRPAFAITLANSISDSKERDTLLQALSEDFVTNAPETAMQFIMEIDDRTLREALRGALDVRHATANTNPNEPTP